MSTRNIDSVTAPPPEVVRGLDDEDEQQDGGWVAWSQVAAAFALYFNHLGLLTSFGVFQTYYATDLLSSSSPSAISWIGSVQVFCLMAVGVIIGPFYDAGYCHILIGTGAVLVVLGFMFTSLGTEYWHILLSQGVCIGLGTCCLSIPSIAIVPMYFTRRRASAMAMSTVGSGLGATLYPLIFENAKQRVGFGWAVRIMGFIALVTCTFAFLTIRPKTRRRSDDKIFQLRFFIDTTAFKEPTFLIYCVAIFFNNLVFFNSSYYIQSYALKHGMQHAHLVQYLVPILNACTIPGRLIPSYIADRVGVLDTFIVVCGLCSASIFYWISVTNEQGNIAFAVIYGFFSGSVVSLAQVVLTGITPDLRRLGTRIGMVSILKGIGSLVGPPISGAILNATGNFLGIQLFSGLGMMLAATFSFMLRLVIVQRSRQAARRREDDEDDDVSKDGIQL